METIKTEIELKGWRGKWLSLFDNVRLEIPIKVDLQWQCVYDNNPSNVIDNYQGFVRKIYKRGSKWFAECELFTSQILSYIDIKTILLYPYCSYYKNKVTNVIYFYPKDKQ